MADSNASRIDEHDCPNGWSCFFVSVGFTKEQTMSEVISIEGKKARNGTDAIDELNTKLRDIYTVATLMTGAEESDLNGADMSSTGYMLERMLDDAKELAKDAYRLGGSK